MKTKQTSPGRSTAGYALLLVMGMTSVSIIILAATMSRNATVSRLNGRNKEYILCQNAAEAAVEKIVARIRYDFVTGGPTQVTNNLALYRTDVPSVAAGDDPYFVNNFQFSDGTTVGKTYVQCISNTVFGPLPSQYSGLYSSYPVYRVLSNAKLINSQYQAIGAVQEDLTLNNVAVFQFAIFYSGLLEFSTCAPFTLNGRVHSNGSIYTGAGGDNTTLIFNSTVTCSGTLSCPANNGHAAWTFPGGTFNGSPGYVQGVPTTSLPIGTNIAVSLHALIDQPPTGEDVNSSLGKQRLFNEANIVLLVSNTTAQVIIRDSTAANDASPKLLTYTNLSSSYLATNGLPWLVTNSFTDRRENSKAVSAVQIDIGSFSKWLATNSSVSAKYPSGSGTYPDIFYVANNKSSTASTLPAVRLMNGAVAPTNNGCGLTVATCNPIYVWGNYNCPDSSALGTTDTSKTVPCAIMSDALTILSSNWKDTNSSNTTPGDASDCTVNSAFLTGTVPSTGTTTTTFSGGVHNLPRLLEDWTGNTLTLNTSIVNMFNSQMATNKFVNPSTYYSPPTRKFSFDLNFVNPSKNPPPGSPNLTFTLRSGWASPPPGVVNYTVTP